MSGSTNLDDSNSDNDRPDSGDGDDLMIVTSSGSGSDLVSGTGNDSYDQCDC